MKVSVYTKGPGKMNHILLLLVVVRCCECGVLPQSSQTTHQPQDTSKNHVQHVAIDKKEIKVQPDVIASERKVMHDTTVHEDKSGGLKNSRADQRFQYIMKETEAKIRDLNKKQPNRVNLRTLPGLERLKQDVSTVSAISSPHTDCLFVCPDAASLSPCTCDPCTRDINCSMVTSFEELHDIFHSTYFPELSLNQFLLVGPFKNGNTATTPNTDTFLSNTFGNVTFTSVRVEEVMQLRVVEAGAFAGSEGTLKEITFRWNSALIDFPFAEMAKMDVLDKLEVRGSSITTAPVMPFTPNLSKLFLSDNYFMTNIPRNAFAQLPSLLLLDLGFSSLKVLGEDSLYFSAQDVLVFLDHNIIDTLHEMTFSGFPCSGLDVSYNNLSSLDQRVFQPILDHIIAQQYNSYIDASYNPLQCGTNGWLMENSFYLSYIILSDPFCK